VEVPFPEMLAGVQAGSIDAGYSPEPFSSAALAAGMREVVDLADPSGPNVGLAVSNFIGGDQFIEDNPNTVAAFARAVYAAGGDILKNEDEFRAWLPGIAHLPEDVAKNMALPEFFDKVHVDKAQEVADLLIKQGLLKKGYDAKKYTYVPEGS
jgi:NitT/TauT family transport system substrate-binding protein